MSSVVEEVPELARGGGALVGESRVPVGRGLFRSHASALCAVVLLVAGHHQALAGDGLYSTGFTHTYAALPLAVAALALAYTGRWVWAFALAGVLFNLHALTAAYAFVM